MRTSLGTQVSVTSSELWFTNLRAGKCFAKGIVNPGAAAAFTYIQLLNPAGSTVQILCRAAIVSVQVADIPLLRRFDTALAGLVGQGTNLLFGGAAGQGAVRQETNAADQGTTLFQEDLQANLPFTAAPEWVCELSPGQGLIFRSNALNIQMASAFYWMEL